MLSKYIDMVLTINLYTWVTNVLFYLTCTCRSSWLIDDHVNIIESLITKINKITISPIGNVMKVVFLNFLLQHFQIFDFFSKLSPVLLFDWNIIDILWHFWHFLTSSCHKCCCFTGLYTTNFVWKLQLNLQLLFNQAKKIFSIKRLKTFSNAEHH